MDIKDRIRNSVGFDAKALELGPSYNPIIAKKDGYKTTVLDHAPRHALISKYSGWTIDADKIEDVDVVSTTVRDAPGRYDHIVASHFVEHTPDLVSFLRDVGDKLTEAGQLHLIVPDRRRVFDALRSPTTTGEVLDAYLLGRKRHVGAIFDTFTNAVSKGGNMLWHPSEPGKYEFKHTYLDARQHTLDAMARTDYIDTHAWCFSPTSFRMIVMDLFGLGLTDLDVIIMHSDPVEFYCVLSKQVLFDLQELSDRREQLRLEVVQECYEVYKSGHNWQA